MRNYRDLFEEGRIYHMYNKVVSNERLFRVEEDYSSFMKRYSKYLSPYLMTYAYALMPNHFHFLVEVKWDTHLLVSKENTNAAKKLISGEESVNYFLENQLSRMFSGYSLSYNSKYNRVGPLFKEGAKRVTVSSEAKLIHQVCYIHHNCIHHHYTQNFKDWKFSSFNSYLRTEESNIERKRILEFFGGKEDFIKVHQAFKLNEEEVFLELDH